MEWLFDSDLNYVNEEEGSNLSAIDMIVWQKSRWRIRISSNQTLLINPDSGQLLYLQYSQDKKLVKLIKINNSIDGFGDKLKGHEITAATDVTLNDTTFVYLFAGRMLCRQELSEQFVKVCDIEDIADWIDCANDADIPGKPGISWFIIVLSFGVIVLLIVVITLTVFLIKRRYDKHNEGPTLRFLDNASTANLRSDIPSPKRRESNEVLMSKKSKVTINKKIENSETTASISDL